MATQDFDVNDFPASVRSWVMKLWGNKYRYGKRFVGRFEYYGSVLTLLFYATILAINIFMRTFAGSQIAWGQEVILGLFTWSTWLGAAYVVKTHQHLRFTGLITKLSNRWTYVVLWLEWLLWIAFSVAAVYYSWPVIQSYQEANTVLTATNIPTSVMFASIPVGFGLIILRVAEQMIVVTREFVGGEDLNKYVELEQDEVEDDLGEEDGTTEEA
jgi:TRAP-type C4-dicarboxylate transport system permease small subunit